MDYIEYNVSLAFSSWAEMEAWEKLVGAKYLGKYSNANIHGFVLDGVVIKAVIEEVKGRECEKAKNMGKNKRNK